MQYSEVTLNTFSFSVSSGSGSIPLPRDEHEARLNLRPVRLGLTINP